MKYTILLWSLLLSLLSAKNLPIEKSLHQGLLPNGLHYTIVHNPKPKDKAELRLLIRAGSLEEENDQRGIAHFVEHMAFNGTEHFPKNELIRYLESIGSTFGSDLNANTGFEHTLYKLTIPLEGNHLQKALLVMRDWAGGINFNAKEFDKERGVILEEARLHDNVGKRLSRAYQQLFFSHSRFMHHDPMGEVAQIKSLRVERAKDFYQQWYRPELMHLIVVGDFNVSTVESAIKEQFSTLINPVHTPLTSHLIPEDNCTRISSFTDLEITSNSVQISYIEQMDTLHTELDRRHGLIESIISTLVNEEAKKQLRKSQPKAQRLGLSSTRLSNQRGGYLFYATYKEGDALLALEELYTLLYGFEQHGFDTQAFQAVITQMQATNEKSYQRLSDLRSEAIAAKLLATLQEDSVYMDYNEDYKLTRKLLSNISLAEVNRYFQKILTIPDRAFFFIGTQKYTYTLAQIESIIQKAKANARKQSYQAEHSPTQLLNKKLSPSKIIEKNHDEQTNITHYTLANGITVDFKPTDFSKNSILLNGFSWGGYSVIEDNNLSQIQKSSTWVEQSAPGNFTPAQLRRLLAGKSLSLSTKIGRFGEHIAGSANTKDMETLFQLLYLKLTQPKIDPLIAQNAKERLKTTLAKSDRNPRYRFNKELMQFYFQNHPRVQFDTIESVNALDKQQMLSLYKERFSDLNNFHFVLIGDSNTTQIEMLITQYLGNLPTVQRQEHFIDRHYTYRKGIQQFVRYYSHDNIATISLLYRSHLVYNNKHNIALTMMQDILAIRLRELIREEKSGVYGISVRGKISRELRDRASSTISFSCDPKRRVELITTIKQQIKILQDQGITRQELSSIQKKYLVAYKSNLKSNRYWASKMMYRYKYKESTKNIFTLEERIKQITPKEIQEVAQRVYGNDLLESLLLPKENNTSKVIKK